MEQQDNKTSFLAGMRDGVPIGLGYFAVAFTLGITAGKAGMNALQSSLMSALMLASAGEFAAISMIASGAGFMEMIITTVVINMRYLLMSSALSQKVQQNRPFLHPQWLAAKWRRAFPSESRPALSNARQRRSEERRVGKECRSRWSPYH